VRALVKKKKKKKPQAPIEKSTKIPHPSQSCAHLQTDCALLPYPPATQFVAQVRPIRPSTFDAVCRPLVDSPRRVKRLQRDRWSPRRLASPLSRPPPRPPPLAPRALAPSAVSAAASSACSAPPAVFLSRRARPPFFFFSRWRTRRQQLPPGRPLRPAARWTRPRRPSRSRCGGVVVAVSSALRARAAAAGGGPLFRAPRVCASADHAPRLRVPPPSLAADGFPGLRQGGQAEGQVGRLARRGAAVVARGWPGH
jgi:hypothetical protein